MFLRIGDVIGWLERPLSRGRGGHPKHLRVLLIQFSQYVSPAHVRRGGSSSVFCLSCVFLIEVAVRPPHPIVSGETAVLHPPAAREYPLFCRDISGGNYDLQKEACGNLTESFGGRYAWFEHCYADPTWLKFVLFPGPVTRSREAHKMRCNAIARGAQNATSHLLNRYSSQATNISISILFRQAPCLFGRVA